MAWRQRALRLLIAALFAGAVAFPAHSAWADPGGNGNGNGQGQNNGNGNGRGNGNGNGNGQGECEDGGARQSVGCAPEVPVEAAYPLAGGIVAGAYVLYARRRSRRQAALAAPDVSA